MNALAFSLFPLCAFLSQGPSETERVLRLVADRVLAEASYQFDDRNSGKRYPATTLAPVGADLKIASPSNDWRYWNGVLDIAMTGVGEALQDSACIAYTPGHVSFVFDNVRYFQQRHAG